jgi:hypothetical protein
VTARREVPFVGDALARVHLLITPGSKPPGSKRVGSKAGLAGAQPMQGESEGPPLSNTPYFRGGGGAAHSDAQQAWLLTKAPSHPEMRP